MKKALLIVLTLGLVVALATPALAVSWIARGAIAIQGRYYKNVDMRDPIWLTPVIGGVPGRGVYGIGDDDPAWNRQSAWVAMRTVLIVTALASRNLYGTLLFEIDSQRWGTGEGSNAFAPWPPAGVDAGAWNADAIAVEVKGMFIDFKVPAIPVDTRIRAGVQPFIKRSSVFMLLDAAGVDAKVTFDISPIKVVINPFWARMLEALDHTQADDQDFYGIDLTVSGGGIAGGLLFAYQARRQLYDAAGAEGDSMQWWIGPHLDVNIGPFNAIADLIFNLGQEDFQGVSSGTPDIDHEGWILRGEASYTWNKLRFGIGGLYGSGDDPTTNDDEGYRVPNGSENAFHNKDFLILTGDWGLVYPYGNNNVGGLFRPRSDVGGGVWYVRGFVDYQVLSWLKLMFNAGYIGDTVDNGDIFGTDFDDDEIIGWELDFGVQINIYKELTLSSAFGYLIAGKALASHWFGDRMQDPWMWATVLTYTF